MKRRKWLQNSVISGAGLMMSPGLAMLMEEEKDLHKIYRLHWNENHFGPSKSVIQAIQDAVPTGNLYWDEKIDILKNDLAKMQGRKEDQYLITSGSTEVLTLLGQHVGLQGKTILTGAKSFPTLPMFGQRCGAKVRYVQMNEYFLDLDHFSESIDSDTGLVFICNPNNPTSTELEPDELTSFCRRVPENVLVCIDEAYIEFSNGGVEKSLIGLVDELPNLIIVRTFSKAYGMAGFRLGYACSQAQNIRALFTRYPAIGMAPGLLPVVGGIAALKDQRFVRYAVDQVDKGKQIVYDAFDRWEIGYPRSSTNFIYARKDGFIPDVRKKLRQENILITQWPSMTDHIRISVGKSEWMQKLVNELEGLRV